MVDVDEACLLAVQDFRPVSVARHDVCGIEFADDRLADRTRILAVLEPPVQFAQLAAMLLNVLFAVPFAPAVPFDKFGEDRLTAYFEALKKVIE